MGGSRCRCRWDRRHCLRRETTCQQRYQDPEYKPSRAGKPAHGLIIYVNVGLETAREGGPTLRRNGGNSYLATGSSVMSSATAISSSFVNGSS
jgi:hypothetical protein